MCCPACRSTESNVEPGHWDTPAGSFGLSRCQHCGTCHTTPLPSTAALAEVYAHSYDYRWFEDHYGAKLRDSRMRVAEYGMFLGERILDFGGGLGYFSRAVRETGRHSVTFDRFRANSQPQCSAWDTVVALHVLEHSNDPDAALEEMKSYLVDGGQLILAVPNYAGLGYRRRGMQWVWAQPPLVHIFHFTAEGLRALLGRHGFSDIAVSFHDRWDANTHCDVDHAEQYARWDGLWRRRPFNRLTAYRRAVAFVNSRRRFAGLARTSASATPADRAELQVTAVLRK